jgi:membrane protease YdiL (CAAX protease family)
VTLLYNVELIVRPLATRLFTPATVATWLAFVAGLVIGGEIEDAGSLVIAAAVGAAVVWVGFAAASRTRAVPRNTPARQARLGLLSLVIGVGLGLANLAANWLIAAADPALREVMVERVATVAPVVGVVAAPIVEEVALRLFLMSAIAWVASRLTHRTTMAFVIGLVGSSLLFALLHLDRPMPNDPTLANYYRTALVVKIHARGVPLGMDLLALGAAVLDRVSCGCERGASRLAATFVLRARCEISFCGWPRTGRPARRAGASPVTVLLAPRTGGAVRGQDPLR